MALRKRTLQDVDLAGRRVFVRVDFNVPLRDGKVADDSRIRAALPTLRRILRSGGSAVVASHLGRPKGKVVEELRLRPVAARLQDLLPGHRVRHTADVAGEQAATAAAALKPGELLLLENLRFEPGETANDEEFCQRLAAMADFFVQDAFGTCHRAHASTAGVPVLLKPAVAGALLEQEIAAFEMVFDDPQRPLVALIGGAKVSDKIPVLENLLDKVDAILVGGGMAYTFLKAQSIGIGSSLCEEGMVDKAHAILVKAEETEVPLRLPLDHLAARACEADAETRISSPHVPDGWMGLDIGPETREKYARELAGAGTVVWNGPMGVFELPPFREGTQAMAHAVADSGSRSVVGGGDSVAALHLTGRAGDITHVSTGGGAFLEMLEGRELPGIAALDERRGVPA